MVGGSRTRFSIAIVVCVIVLGFNQASKLTNESETNHDKIANSTNETHSYSARTEHRSSLGSEYVDVHTLSLHPAVHKPKVLNSIYAYIYDREQFHLKETISDYTRTILSMKLHVSISSDIFMHRYDNFKDLKESGGPAVDQELCLRQLEHLNDRAELQRREKYSSKDINLHQLLDTFGHLSSGLFLGDTSWPGQYGECLRLQIRVQSGKSATRYCWASIKYNSWPENDVLSDFLTIKSAVCLPKACDSLNYKTKYQLIERLQDFNVREVDRGQSSVTGLYCLPDEESSLRQWWLMPQVMVPLALIVAWIWIQVCATKKYASLCEESKYLPGADAVAPGPSDKLDKSCDGLKTKTELSFAFKIYRSLSISNNFRLWLNIAPGSRDTTPGKGTEGEIAKPMPIIDFRVLEGTKVVSMCYVITGHVLMIIVTSASNTGEMKDTKHIAYLLANLVPAFTVNSFFVITGLLTSYLMFKHNQSMSLFKNPARWTIFVLQRYLRIMPMYLLVVLYCKYLAKFASSGPYWDYATSAVSLRKNCEQESWLWTLLMVANFKSPVHHCIPAAWYLADDFQFFIITPLFLAILHKWPKSGQKFIKLCMTACFIASFYSIYGAELQDLRPIAKFSNHGFKSYVTHFDFNYTRPQYRLPAYLCGLLVGYSLFKFERNKLKYLEKKAKLREMGETKALEELVEPGWAKGFERKAIRWSRICFILTLLSSYVGSILPFNLWWARFMVALGPATFQMLFSLAVGYYVMLASTGCADKSLSRVLAAPFWKPLARLSLCAVLVNIEVVNYLVSSGHRSRYLNNESLISMNILTIICTYLVSMVLHVLFEMPIKLLLTQLISHAVADVSRKQKSD